MSARIDLDALERLAEEAGDGLTGWWEHDEFVEGAVLPRDVAAFLATCDPVTVAALVRAVKAAKRWAEYDGLDSGEKLRDLRATLAPFAPDPGEAAPEQAFSGVARVAGSVAQEGQP